MAFIVTKRGTAGQPRGPQRRVKEPEAWGLPMRHLLGFFIRAIWRFTSTSTWPQQSSQAKEQKRCAKLEHRVSIHHYLGAMLQLTKNQH